MKPLEERDLQDRLKHTLELDVRSFHEVVEDESKDVVVYFYSSQNFTVEYNRSFQFAIHVNRMSERFAEMEIDSVVTARFDISLHYAPG